MGGGGGGMVRYADYLMCNFGVVRCYSKEALDGTIAQI